MTHPTVEELQTAIHANAIDHGWWDTPRSFAEVIALCHSELSEALEADRNGGPLSTKCPGYSQVAEELADCIIRILDYAERAGVDMAAVIAAKHAFNKTRPYRHGKRY